MQYLHASIQQGAVMIGVAARALWVKKGLCQQLCQRMREHLLLRAGAEAAHELEQLRVERRHVCARLRAWHVRLVAPAACIFNSIHNPVQPIQLQEPSTPGACHIPSRNSACRGGRMPTR
jgi:hypothetical protein